MLSDPHGTSQRTQQQTGEVLSLGSGALTGTKVPKRKENPVSSQHSRVQRLENKDETSGAEWFRSVIVNGSVKAVIESGPE
jgi:hypothetical protein